MRLISCGSKKRDCPCPAQDLYIGSLFVAARKWAEQSPDGKWAILSAQWGLLLPFQQVAPYNYTFKKAPQKWVASVLNSLEKLDAEEIEIAAPIRYCEPLLKDVRVSQVLKGVGGMGYQLQWFKRNTKK